MTSRLKLHYSPKRDQWWFTLSAMNGKILMTSEMYETKRGAERGMAAARKVMIGG